MNHNMQTLINSRKLFFQIMLLLLAAAFLLWLFFGKTFASVSLHDPHPFWLNVFFINYTFMGNGLFVVCLALVLIFRFKKNQQGIAILYGFFLSVVVIQLLKNIDNLSNPVISFEQGQTVFTANNISLIDLGSFISGHTTIAFALATVLSLTIKNSKWQLLLLAAALLLGYSRIYLEQAFLPGIIIAAVVGTVSGITAVYLAYYFKGYGYYFQKSFRMHKRVAIPVEENVQIV